MCLIEKLQTARSAWREEEKGGKSENTNRFGLYFDCAAIHIIVHDDELEGLDFDTAGGVGV